MNRRGFLSSLMGACALDPERLLWVPGRKLVSIPAVQSVSGPPVIPASVLARMDAAVLDGYQKILGRFFEAQNTEDLPPSDRQLFRRASDWCTAQRDAWIAGLPGDRAQQLLRV